MKPQKLRGYVSLILICAGVAFIGIAVFRVPVVQANGSSSLLAHSVWDWSTTGMQGVNGWYYGFWNKTGDADGTYNPSTDFNTSDPNWNFVDGAWKLGPGDPPWDKIGQTEWHPSGVPAGDEIHWVIKRWVSTTAGNLGSRVRFGKVNPGCGNGTTLHVLHNGLEVFVRTVAYNDISGFEVDVELPGVAAGDFIEFALDPLGTDASYSDFCDGSQLSAIIYTGLFPIVANSVEDWSTTGVQGENGWLYGFWNKTGDADDIYNPDTDFNITDPNWNFVNGAWVLGPGDPPWDKIGQTEWHPSGFPAGDEIHWVIRRWISSVDGDLHSRVRFGKVNPGCGNGTTLHVLHNGLEVFVRTVAYNDISGFEMNVDLPGVVVGDYIDFALDPRGTDASYSDFCDGSWLSAIISTAPFPIVANSVEDWSTTGGQGVNGWYYGFWNKTLDADGIYNPSIDFNTTDPNWIFFNGAWVLGPGDPPWDKIGQTDWHPNGIPTTGFLNEIHWVIRRWVSNTAGDLHSRVRFGKVNLGCGNGTTLHVLHNGLEVFVRTVGYNDISGFEVDVDLPGVAVGDFIEFALDPLGTDASYSDFCDGSRLSAIIFSGTAGPCLTNLAARAKSRKVQLTWTYTGADQYNIYRGTVAGGPYTFIGSTTSTYSTYLDVTVTNGTTYYYVVRPVTTGSGEICQSYEVNARPLAR